MAGKPVTKKTAPKCAPIMAFKVAPKAPRVAPKAPRVAPKAPKVKGPSIPYEFPDPSLKAKQGIPTASLLKSIAEHKAGNVTRYADEDDLFRKLGIKVGKT
jgi:hypothetical protein